MVASGSLGQAEALVAEYLEYPLPSFVARPQYLIELPEPRQRNLIYSLIGVRRCGKTFALFQLMDSLLRKGVPRARMLFFPFDDERFDLARDGAPTEVVDAYFKLVPEAAQGCYLFFDEIQEAPAWDAFVRRVAEQYPTTVVVTGSSSKLLSTDIPTRLRGRSLSEEIWPLDFGEWCVFHDVDTTDAGGAYPALRRGTLERAFDEYLAVGGFPAVQGLGQTDRVRLLQSYADEIVTKDVLERFGSASFRAGRRYARTVLRHSGLKFSVNRQVKSFRSLGVSLFNEAAYALLDDFEDAHLAFKVADYNLSARDNPKSAYKLYAVDQGLVLAVAPANHFDLGQRLETAVYVELRRRYGHDRDNVIASYSSMRRPEVDFVVGDLLMESQTELVQVAVESGEGAKRQSEVGNLAVAMGETGLDTSTLVTLCEEAEVVTDTGIVRVVPAWKWFLGR